LIVEKAVKMPLQLNGLFKFLIGAVLAVIPIVNLTSLGYCAEVMERSARREAELPSWNNLGAKFIKGLSWSAIALVYLLVPAALATVGGQWSQITVQTSTEGMNPFAVAALGGTALWAAVLALILGFILPMGLAHYSATGDLTAPFRLPTVLRYIAGNFSSYLPAYALAILLYYVVSLFGNIPSVGPVLTVPGYFYATVVLAAVFGSVYQRARIVESTR